MKKDDMMKRSRARARENHVSGMNCGESTFRAVLETLREEALTDVPIEMVMLATGLGGGIGSSGNTCCAVIGAALGMSSVHGRKDPFELPTPFTRRDQLGGENGRYRLYNNMVHELRGNIGSISCAELTCPFDYYSDERKESCRAIIGEAAALAIKWTIIGIEEGYRHPFHYNIMGKK